MSTRILSHLKWRPSIPKFCPNSPLSLDFLAQVRAQIAEAGHLPVDAKTAMAWFLKLHPSNLFERHSHYNHHKPFGGLAKLNPEAPVTVSYANFDEHGVPYYRFIPTSAKHWGLYDTQTLGQFNQTELVGWQVFDYSFTGHHYPIAENSLYPHTEILAASHQIPQFSGVSGKPIPGVSFLSFSADVPPTEGALHRRELTALFRLAASPKIAEKLKVVLTTDDVVVGLMAADRSCVTLHRPGYHPLPLTDALLNAYPKAFGQTDRTTGTIYNVFPQYRLTPDVFTLPEWKRLS